VTCSINDGGRLFLKLLVADVASGSLEPVKNHS